MSGKILRNGGIKTASREEVFGHCLVKFPLDFYPIYIDISVKTAYNIYAGSNALYTRGNELTFKRYLISSSARSPYGDFFFEVFWEFAGCMNIFVYSDESGVFDKEHNKYFVFGGVIFLSKEERDIASRKYIAAERVVRTSENITSDMEVKASLITNKSKGKLYRSLNSYYKFGIVADQSRVLDRIFESKKDKQRYLDYVYKIGLKLRFQHMISNGIIVPSEVERLIFYVDEHTTATNGRYELRESLEQEFKYGTYNWNYSCHFPPIFPNLQELKLDFCNSASKTLVRAADIVANKVYRKTIEENVCSMHEVNSMYIVNQP